MKYSIYSVNLDPTIGFEMNKTRPCLVISPDEMNNYLQTAIISPITSIFRNIPTRILIKPDATNGLKSISYIALDQIKTIDKRRLGYRIGSISAGEAQMVAEVLAKMFEY